MESLPPRPPKEPSGAPAEPEEEPAAPHAEPARASTGTPQPDEVSDEAPDAAPPPEGEADAATPAAGTEAPAGTGTEAAHAPARRPRGRTSLLLASAALLGIVAGVATGYTIQADREPTPLPPLSRAKLAYPAEHVPEDEWEPVPARHDHRVRTDGDLRELLVGKPKGARDSAADRSPDGWVSLGTYAREYERPGDMFGRFLGADIRRIAGVTWESGQYRTTSVRLVQFHGLEERAARDHAEEQQAYMSRDAWAASSGQPIEGSGNGLYWVDEAPERKPGYLPSYVNRAIAWRGDIVMDLQIHDTEPVSEKAIRELAERQWERL